MEEKIPESELVLNADGSIYHLHLLPEDIGDTIILVGDPDRVAHVSGYFDRITVKKQKREFITHSGYVGAKYVSVISTGIGTDNIDIVLNELDTLANVNLQTRVINKEKKALKFIRIGTSGSLQPDIQIDDLVLSTHGLGLDALMQFYDYEEPAEISTLLSAIDEQLDLVFVNPYLFKAPGNLISLFGPELKRGITATCCGFYGPQGRTLRAPTRFEDLVNRLHHINVDGTRVSNFEMETAGIYGLATLLGHEALSVNAILAQRIEHQFSSDSHAAVDKAIRTVMAIIEKT